MCDQDMAARRARDLARYHRRTAERIAAGLCPRCGKADPLPGRCICAPCNDRSNETARARDARLRAAGIPRRDPERAREYERERSRRETAERRAGGICTKCGGEPAAQGRRLCAKCADKRRIADRARYAEAKARGAKYGGKNPQAKRRAARAGSAKRHKARIGAGMCTRCGRRPPAGGGTTCASCRGKRRAAERRQYAERTAAGCCTKCGGPVYDGLTRCRPCAINDQRGRSLDRKNARSRRLYAERRARGLCTSCGAPSQGAARCLPCAERSHRNSHHFRGIPVWDPSFTVVELATGREHGSFDSEADVALCLAFAKLRRDQVEVVSDASPMSSFTASV